jgi:hypothetical protein
MKLEGDQPIIESTDDAVLIASALQESMPVNNRHAVIDADCDRWNKRVDDAIEALEDTFGVYQDDGEFYMDNSDSWLNAPGEVNLFMPVTHFRGAVELYREQHATDERRSEAAEHVLWAIAYVTGE